MYAIYPLISFNTLFALYVRQIWTTCESLESPAMAASFRRRLSLLTLFALARWRTAWQAMWKGQREDVFFATPRAFNARTSEEVRKRLNAKGFSKANAKKNYISVPYCVD